MTEQTFANDQTDRPHLAPHAAGRPTPEALRDAPERWTELPPGVAGDAALDRALAMLQGSAALPGSLREMVSQPVHWRSGARMSPAAWRWLVQTLSCESMTSHHEGLRAVRRRLDDLDCHKLCRRMLDTTRDPDQGWPLFILAVVGSPYQIEKLGRDLEGLTRDRGQQGALEGVEVLRRSDAPAAIRWLDHWSQADTLVALSRAASQGIEARAADAGVTVAELVEDNIGHMHFDDQGQQRLDYGPRQIIARLTPRNKLLFEDERGEVRNRIPRPRASDDKEVAELSRAYARDLKRQLKLVRKQQRRAMRRALRTGQRWTTRAWRQRFMNHPLWRSYARLFIFTHEDEHNGARHFNLGADGLPRDARDHPFHLGVEGTVKLAHPVAMDRKARRRWRDWAERHQLKPSFRQIRRLCWSRDGQPDDLAKLCASLHQPSVAVLQEQMKAADYTAGPRTDGMVHDMTGHIGPHRVHIRHTAYHPRDASPRDRVGLLDVHLSLDGREIAAQSLNDEVYSELLRDLHLLTRTRQAP